MTQLVALHKQHHNRLKINTDLVESIGANEKIIPVVLDEFTKLAVQYPIVLTKNEESGRFVPVVLLGFNEQENLFWQNDFWDAIYIPLNITRQPFFIGRDESSGKQIICIDVASPCISMERGESIYEADGEEAPFMLKIRERLSMLLQGERNSQAFIEALIKYDLITPLSLDVTFVDNSQHTVKGIYSVDEEKMKALDHGSLIELHKANLLHPIYTMMDSLAHIYSLVQRKNLILRQTGSTDTSGRSGY